MQQSQLVWGYRAALGLLLIALLCPWVTAESSATVRYGDMGRDMSGMGLGAYGGDQMRQLGNQSASLSLSVSGLGTLWGKGILLTILIGAALSFIGPAGFISPGKENIVMAGIGGVSLLLAMIVLFTASSYVNQGATVSSQYASTSAHASVAWGWYIAVLGTLAATVLGFMVDWRQAPSAYARATNAV